MIKVALSMKNGVIPKQVNFDEPNPHIDWNRLPMRVPLENVEWDVPSDRPRMAAVSGFGMSGANAHLLIADYAGMNGEAVSNNGFRTVNGGVQEVGIEIPDRFGGFDDRGRRGSKAGHAVIAGVREVGSCVKGFGESVSVLGRRSLYGWKR